MYAPCLMTGTSAWAATPNTIVWGLKQQMCMSYSPGVWEVQVQVWRGWVLLKALLMAP